LPCSFFESFRWKINHQTGSVVFELDWFIRLIHWFHWNIVIYRYYYNNCYRKSTYYTHIYMVENNMYDYTYSWVLIKKKKKNENKQINTNWTKIKPSFFYNIIVVIWIRVWRYTEEDDERRLATGKKPKSSIGPIYTGYLVIGTAPGIAVTLVYLI